MRTKITRLTKAQTDAIHAQLARDWARSQVLIARQAEIVARIQAQRATVYPVIEARYKLALARHALKVAKPTLPLTDLPMFAPLGTDAEAA